MKVFELMKDLSKMPAGADIEFSCLLEEKEFYAGDITEDDGKVFHEVRVTVKEADAASEKTIFIYG